MEPLKGWVKAFKPTNLQDAIWRTRDLGLAKNLSLCLDHL
jgi:hypothetical protein